MFYSTSIPSLDFRESQTGETPMRRSSLVDSYIGHVGERERETVKERRGDSTQGLSLERERRTEVLEKETARLSFVAAGTSVEETLAFFQHFVHLRSPSGRERENRARRATHNNFLLDNRPTERPTDRPTDRWSVQTTRLSGANLISGRRREESLPTPRIRWRASKQLNYSLLHTHRYFHISRLNSL